MSIEPFLSQTSPQVCIKPFTTQILSQVLIEPFSWTWLKVLNISIDIVKMNGTRYSELNLYLTEDIISQSFFYIGWNCLECIIN
jgi:hypothetical protein